MGKKNGSLIHKLFNKELKQDLSSNQKWYSVLQISAFKGLLRQKQCLLTLGQIAENRKALANKSVESNPCMIAFIAIKTYEHSACTFQLPSTQQSVYIVSMNNINYCIASHLILCC